MICSTCKHTFPNTTQLNRHLQRKFPCGQQKPTEFTCDKCGSSFSRKFNLERHQTQHCKAENKSIIEQLFFQLNYPIPERKIPLLLEIVPLLDTQKNTFRDIIWKLFEIIHEDFVEEMLSGLVSIYTNKKELHDTLLLISQHFNHLFTSNTLNFHRKKTSNLIKSCDKHIEILAEQMLTPVLTESQTERVVTVSSEPFIIKSKFILSFSEDDDNSTIVQIS